MPGIEVDRRDSNLGEVELIRTVEEAAIGKLIARDRPVLGRCRRDDNLVERRFPKADIGDIAGSAPDVGAVVVDVGGDLAGCDGRVVGPEGRAQETRLLSANEVEQDRAPRSNLELLHCARYRQHLSDAGCVVERTVVDRVVSRSAVTDVIVVRRVDDELIGKLRIAAWQLAEHIGRLSAADRVGQGEAGGDAERYRLKVALPGVLSELVQIEAGGREVLAGGLFGGPGADRDP